MNRNLPLALFLLRFGVFVVFFMWTLDKFLNPQHAAAVFEKYYKIGDLGSSAAYIIGSAQMLLLLAFLFGIWKSWSYGLVFILHAISTASTWKQLINPWQEVNLLFYAAIPMLMAIAALWLLRKDDSMITLGKR